MSLYYEKKLISGVRDVPSMTLAQYNALTNKPKLWERTDAPESDRGINADDIEYSNGVSVKEKIDEVNGTSVTVTTEQGVEKVYDNFVKVGSAIIGTMQIRFSGTANTWVDIATINKKPVQNALAPTANAGDGSFGGMVEVNSSTGKIRAYIKNNLSNGSIVFTLSYKTTD